MTALETAWLAGLLEGEGCFTLHPERPHIPARAFIQLYVGMTDEDVVLRAAELIGGKVNVRQRHSGDSFPNAKPLFFTSVAGQKAEDVMRAVQPFMGSRRKAKITTILQQKNLSHQ